MGKEVASPAWSYSSIKMFEQCPKKYFHLKVVKDYKEPFGGEAILYGNQFHEAAEFFVKGTKPLPAKFDFARAALESLKNLPGKKHCELKLGLTENLEACGFFDKDVWFRSIVDLLIIDEKTGVAYIVDYKTGKSATYADVGQLELMALAVFKHYPKVKKIKAGLLFVVCNAFIKETYPLSSESELWAKWLGEYGKIQKAHKTGVWNPQPSGLCRNWCVVLSCAHNGRSE